MAEGKTISDFIDFLKRKKTIERVREFVPNWRELLSDPENLPAIENINLDYDAYENVFEIVNQYSKIIRVAGLALALKWLTSSDQYKVWAAEDFFKEFSTAFDLSVETWRSLDEKAKFQIVNNIFRSDPGEPFHFLREIYFDLHSPDSIQFKRDREIIFWFPSLGYVPSPNVVHLRSIIEEAGDTEFLKIVDQIMERYRQACDRLSMFEGVFRFLHNFSLDERELIARALEPFLENGFSLSLPPPVFISFETPPYFLAYPQYDRSLDERIKIPFRIEDLTEDRGQRLIPPEKRIVAADRQRSNIGKVAIEDMLGVYRAFPEPKIIVFYKGLVSFNLSFSLDEVLVKSLTILHLIGHWIVHSLPCEQSTHWAEEKYSQASRELLETLAQLITFWVADTLGGKIKRGFDRLNSFLPEEYLKFKEFRKEDKKKVINAIKKLRNISPPVTINEWKALLQEVPRIKP